MYVRTIDSNSNLWNGRWMGQSNQHRSRFFRLVYWTQSECRSRRIQIRRISSTTLTTLSVKSSNAIRFQQYSSKHAEELTSTGWNDHLCSLSIYQCWIRYRKYGNRRLETNAFDRFVCRVWRLWERSEHGTSGGVFSIRWLWWRRWSVWIPEWWRRR